MTNEQHITYAALKGMGEYLKRVLCGDAFVSLEVDDDGNYTGRALAMVGNGDNFNSFIVSVTVEDITGD